ncbi:MAG: L-2-hydroxyglutarate oxidase [bacterium]|nr:L-2-hydroxyglutarate oxidase [bacterium]
MDYNITIIGAGIVGLSCGLKLLEIRPDLKVCILEKEDGIARHQTGNNSGVIHSGIYYKPGSLKADNCADGYRKLLDFCDMENIPYEICGKLIVAVDERERETLHFLYNRGRENGLRDLRLLSREEIKEQEPYVAGMEGIHVPQTGIISFTDVSEAFARIIKEKDGKILLNEKVISIKRNSSGRWEVITEKNSFASELVINCAGIYSDDIARLTASNIGLKIIPFRGEYYKIRENRKHLVKNLVYPVPDPTLPMLGVHFTRMISGEIEAGPNAVLAFSKEGYRKTDIVIKELFGSLLYPGFFRLAKKYMKTGIMEMRRSFSKKLFAGSLQRLIPEIQEADIERAGAGVRAQACDRSGKLIDDFVFVEGDGIINILNAPSPAATSSLAIGETIAGMAVKRLDK